MLWKEPGGSETSGELCTLKLDVPHRRMVASEDAADASVVREAAGVSAGVMTEQVMERGGGLFRLFLSYPHIFQGFGL